MATRPQDSPICPGSGTFPDIVSDRLLDERSYVCAACGTSVPNFEPAPVHPQAVPMVRSDPAVIGFTTEKRTGRA
jgi:hypothetical protein